MTNNLNSSVPFTDFLAPQSGSGGSMPKAYLNILFFDEQFKFVSQNSEIVQISTKGSGQTIYRVDGDAKEAVKNGYAYVYVSNESNNLVYFDNLRLTHERGPILEETHYYPFGLTMTGISSQALTFWKENKIKFQGQEFASKEFSDGSGLEMYEFKYRMDDPQTGRFWQIDPLADKYVYNSTYAFSENKVTSHIELEGLEAVEITPEMRKTLDEINRDLNKPRGDQEGMIRNATTQESNQNPITAFFKDALHFFAEITGLNTVDNASANIRRKMDDGTLNTGDVVVAAVTVGMAMPGEGGGKKVGVKPANLDGSFSITKEGWKGYPTTGNVPKPEGPFRIIEGTEYTQAKNSANNANKSLHRQDPSLQGQQIHEVHPVKFGGNPTDVGNKVPLSRQQHIEYTNWWNGFWKNIRGF